MASPSQQDYCPACGQATTLDGHDKSGHSFYGRWLSFRDFERILLSLGAAGSDVRRLWPGEDLADETDAPVGPRTETDYLLQIDYTRYVNGGTGTWTKRLGVVTEEQALAEARAALDLDSIVYRVDVFAREVPVEWTKVEEVRRAAAGGGSA